MADKEVLINGIHVGYATNAKVTPSYETEETPTFDGPVIDGSDEPRHSVTVEKLRYGTITDYIQLNQLLLNMQSVSYSITIIEKAKMKDGTATIKDIVYDCKVDGNEYDLNPDERTAESLSFTGGKRTRWINGKQIKKTV